ncbi:hypothetical protein QWY77_13865 [Thalassotalea ponticola]|nr:hypothetical protein [Thalassotalea ponticola]MDN3653828.1 hypothetical protein [Thalassotalea ponticola]
MSLPVDDFDHQRAYGLINEILAIWLYHGIPNGLHCSDYQLHQTSW